MNVTFAAEPCFTWIFLTSGTVGILQLYFTVITFSILFYLILQLLNSIISILFYFTIVTLLILFYFTLHFLIRRFLRRFDNIFSMRYDRVRNSTVPITVRAYTRAHKIKKYEVHRHVRRQVAKFINAHTGRNIGQRTWHANAKCSKWSRGFLARFLSVPQLRNCFSRLIIIITNYFSQTRQLYQKHIHCNTRSYL